MLFRLFFGKTIAACDLKVGRCRQLIEIMKACEYLLTYLQDIDVMLSNTASKTPTVEY